MDIPKIDSRSIQKPSAESPRWQVAARSEQGPRDYQQDAFLWQEIQGFEDRPRLCCVLADGMGGVAGGRLASRTAAQAILEHLIPSLLSGTEGQWRDPAYQERTIQAAFDRAGAVLRRLADAATEFEEMGSTVSVTVHLGDQVIVGWAGDSRVYALGRGLELLTRDHSVAWELVESGSVSPSELRHVGTRSMLTRYLGPDCSNAEIIRWRSRGDRVYLLSTDGFWELFDVEELEHQLRPNRPDELADPEALADRLVEEWGRRGPADNATFILVSTRTKVRERTGRYPCLRRLPAFVPTVEEEVHDAGQNV